MPFPLAHPAAVLPFRRFCPRWLSFLALVIGSLAPDLSYCFGNLNLHHLAHHPVGTLAFSLPAGLLGVGLLYWTRLLLVRALPERHRHPFNHFCEQPRSPLIAVIISVMLGAWTHILLDGLSHSDGWIVTRLPVMRTSVGAFWGHRVTIYQICWFGLTFAGVGWLALSYLSWLQKASGSIRFNVVGRWTYAFGMAVLAILLALAHRLLHHPLGLYAIIAGMLVLAAGFVMHSGSPKRI